MARIILETNEIFEHFHSDDSTSELISGEALYHCEGQTIKMKIGEKIHTPAGSAHKMENIGKSNAQIDCNHVPD